MYHQLIHLIPITLSGKLYHDDSCYANSPAIGNDYLNFGEFNELIQELVDTYFNAEVNFRLTLR